MSRSPPAISIQNVSKSFVIAHRTAAHTTLAEALTHRLRRPFARSKRETFWALRELSLEIAQGEVIGIIGRNGAGKSTLLKILGRITRPTMGQVELYGPVGSLLEVGTGFHPELTGRENIYLNGQILGMRRQEINRQFDAIVDFAGTERFLDTPVKRYSSGMYVRLAFAVAAHLDAQILLVDEVLAVGDTEFQKKCLGKMNEVARTGRTVLFVSHNMAAIAKLCARVAVLSGGSLAYVGPTDDAIAHYLAAVTSAPAVRDTIEYERPSWAMPIIERVAVQSSDGASKTTFAIGEDLIITARVKANGIRSLVAGVVVNCATGASVGGLNTRMTGTKLDADPGATMNIACILRQPPLAPGRYSVDFWIGDGQVDLDTVPNAVAFDVEATDFYRSGVPPFHHLGPMVLKADWQSASV